VVFLALFAVFLVWTFPHRRIVERMVARRLAGLDVAVTMGAVAPSLWPPGYRIGDVEVHGRGYSLDVDSIRLGLGPSSRFRADVCGGSLEGDISRVDGAQKLDVSFADVDPASCIDLKPLEVSGSFRGSAALEGLGAGPPASVLGRAARGGTFEIEGVKGVLAGAIPQASTGAQPPAAQPIGSWEVQRASMHAHVEGPEVVIDDATAEAEGLHWELSGGRLTPGMASRTRINIDLRARRLDDSPRAKAMIGLLPRAGEDANGWRRYRITGTLDAPRIVGLK
jgi:type II secretion system protein N